MDPTLTSTEPEIHSNDSDTTSTIPMSTTTITTDNTTTTLEDKPGKQVEELSSPATATISSPHDPTPITSSSSSTSASSSSSSPSSASSSPAPRPFRVTIMTSGSRGDVQPYAVLALGLKQRGHQVRLATEERMRSFVESMGVEYAHVAGDPIAVLFTKEGQQMLNNGSFLKLLSHQQNSQKEFYEECLGDYLKACDGWADIIITGPLCMTQALCIAEKMRVPCLPLLLGPSFPTDEFPIWVIATAPLPFKFMNKLTYTTAFWAMWKGEKGNVNNWRVSTLGLPEASDGPLNWVLRNDQPILHAFHPTILHNQKVPHDWPAKITKVTGFIYPPRGALGGLGSKLEDFLKDGPAPIYLGFGSMPAPDPAKLVKLAIDVVKSLQRRAVIIAGWSGIDVEGELSHVSSICVVPSAPHDELFPRCHVIVHHGGIGTIVAALRSGRPQVVCPFYLDQPCWAQRMQDAGVAPAPVPFLKLTAPRLVQALQEVMAKPAIYERAQDIARSIAQEDGLATCVQTIEDTINSQIL
eukprot:TRINITY_DN4081_c0_g2_i1.p1 TRINITY_DN4081_c0_g2~~TRINITY_DN4081_c0_g2_i1.p1  ORF type:complete len:525 (-),score=94.98 TRINITY_DN4081_c0_g2_i1:21-1595(-)